MMFLDPVDNDKKHQTKGIETAGFDVGVLIREVRIWSQKRIECFILCLNSNSHSSPPVTHLVTRLMLVACVL